MMSTHESRSILKRSPTKSRRRSGGISSTNRCAAGAPAATVRRVGSFAAMPPRLPSHAHRGEPPPLRQEIVDDARSEDAGEEAREDAHAERHREAAHGTRAELEQNDPTGEGRDVRIPDRVPGPLVARLDRRADALAEPQLLADALEDEHVGIDRHPHG